jgi:hypothetical protein
VTLNVTYRRQNPIEFIFNLCSSLTARDQVSCAKELTWRNSGLVFIRSYAKSGQKNATRNAARVSLRRSAV